MAAVAAVIDLVPVGSIVLIPKHAYMASVTLCKDLERRGIIELVRVDIEDTERYRRYGGCRIPHRRDPGKRELLGPKVLAWLEAPLTHA